MTRPPPRSPLFPSPPFSRSGGVEPAVFFALEFPSIDHLVKWPSLGLKGTPFEINKTVLLTWLAVVIVLGLFWVASRSAALVPKDRKSTRLNSSHLVISYAVF